MLMFLRCGKIPVALHTPFIICIVLISIFYYNWTSVAQALGAMKRIGNCHELQFKHQRTMLKDF